ncbi:lipopolysaccharide heptosyltransferase I [Acidithiobacillus sp. IBUN Pt1247-S3]|uniref:lipopolysaccharide heptosyltransferase I n=1 Tax=Acidithiobacillus sp. IBUN Pt1247-S3 TaxID=3166642 RepID=UPI0034E60A5F
MKLLLVRLSSLGDVLHTLPALTDLHRARPELELHWLLEPGFAAIAAWHPAVARVLPFSLRQFKGRWRGLPKALVELRRELRTAGYAGVLDSQGLYKSALLARLAGAPVWGLDRQSAREPGASRLYTRRFAVPWGQPAILRNRQLFAQALGYGLPNEQPDYGLAAVAEAWRRMPLSAPWAGLTAQPFVIGFHATSQAWTNKEWPVQHWQALARQLAAAGLRLLLPAVDARERSRVESIAKTSDNVLPLPAAGLEELAMVMVRAQAFVGMDTGLSYLAAALGVRGVTLYGPTAPEQGVEEGRWPTLVSGEPCAPCGTVRCRRISSAGEPIPCQESLLPQSLWSALALLLEIAPQ